MVNLHRSIDEACERLVSFASTCPLEVQSIQGLQFALADFDSELSMALASAEGASAEGKDEELDLPTSLHNLAYHKDTYLRTVGWRALTHLVKSQAPIDIFGAGGKKEEGVSDDSSNNSGKKKRRHEGKLMLVHLVRALDGGGGSIEEHLEALQFVLALCLSAKHIRLETTSNQDSGQDSGLWPLVLPSIVQSCEIGEDSESREAQSAYNPRIILTSLQVLRNIAIHLPHRVRSLKHIKPLLHTLCTLSFLDANSAYALNLNEAQRESIALASEYTLSLLLSNVTVRRNLGWDISSILGPIISPFMNIAIAQVPEKEEDIWNWDQADTLRILPHCMKGLFRLSRSWTGTYLLTKYTKAEKSILQVLVQAFGDAKGDLVRCVFVILFSGLLGMPIDEGAAKYWIEHTGVDLGFDDTYFNGGSMVGALDVREDSSSTSSSSSGLLDAQWDGDSAGTQTQHEQGNVTELANRVHQSILANAIFEAGLHFHLKNALKEKFEPKKSIPLLLERILEIAHACLAKEKVVRMQGSHHQAPLFDEQEKNNNAVALGLEEACMGELPDISYVVSQSEMKDDSTVSKLQRIIWSSNASSTNNLTASDERKTLVKTLKDSGAARAGGAFQSIALPGIEESDLRQSNQNNPVLDQKLDKLQQLMEDSLVLRYSSAYWKKWNWEYIGLILDFCKGMPEEGIKACMRGKLLKRIFAFYAKRLPSVPIENYKGRVSVHCGMKLVKLMIETEEGRNFLSGKSSFLDQLPEVNVMDAIAKGLLLEARPAAAGGGGEKGRIFHPAMLRHTHAFGLLQMVLQIGDKRRGIQMLYQLGVVQALEEVLQCKTNPELCKMIFNQLNLFINDFPQKLVSASLASSDSPMFSHAILCLKRNLLLLPAPKDLVDASTKKTVAWFAKVIVSCIEGANHLQQSCGAILGAKFCSLGYTKYLFTAGIAKLEDGKLKPFPNLVQHLLLHEDGFAFVSGKGWLEDHVRSQFSQEKTTAFIDIVNTLFSSNTLRTLQSAFDVASVMEKDLATGLDGMSRELYLKNVFYCLGCTEKGMDWLAEHKVVQMLVERLEDDDEKDVNKKAYLWYLALIASAGEAAGNAVIEGGGIDEIQFIAANSTNFMIRGEALVALNLACNNATIANHVKDKYHSKWVVFGVDRRIRNAYTRLCLPQDVSAYLNLPRKKTMMYIQGWCASYRHRKEKAADANLKTPNNNTLIGANSHLISSAFGKLGNPIAEDQGKLDLAKIKRSSPDTLTMLNSSAFLHQLFMTMEVPKSARNFMWDVVD